MKHRVVRRGTAAAALLAASGLMAACVPPTPPAQENWRFTPTQVTVNESQDCLLPRLPNPFGPDPCTSFDETDETYLLSIGFRVKVGVPNSAQTWVAGSRDNTVSVSEGGTAAVGTQNATVFNNVAPLDVIDIVTQNGQLEVVGTYVWASEKDSIGNGLAADGTASVFKDALNATVAQGSIPSDLNQLLDILLDNIGSALGILVQNIPTFGLGDDVLGGGLYIGVAAKGDLANIINAAIPGVSFNFSIPVADIPPDIQRGGIFTFGGTSTFNGQLFDGSCLIPQCGKHTYNFQVSKI